LVAVAGTDKTGLMTPDTAGSGNAETVVGVVVVFQDVVVLTTNRSGMKHACDTRGLAQQRLIGVVGAHGAGGMSLFTIRSSHALAVLQAVVI
jgi:hypothetical protein